MPRVTWCRTCETYVEAVPPQLCPHCDHDYKRGGWKTKYVVEKADGSDVDPEAVYFVLRLDEDPNARAAMRAYAESVVRVNEELAFDIVGKLDQVAPEETGPWFTSLLQRVAMREASPALAALHERVQIVMCSVAHQERMEEISDD